MLCRLFIILFTYWHTHILKIENPLLNQDEYKKDCKNNYMYLHLLLFFHNSKI